MSKSHSRHVSKASAKAKSWAWTSLKNLNDCWKLGLYMSQKSWQRFKNCISIFLKERFDEDSKLYINILQESQQMSKSHSRHFSKVSQTEVQIWVLTYHKSLQDCSELGLYMPQHSAKSKHWFDSGSWHAHKVSWWLKNVS